MNLPDFGYLHISRANPSFSVFRFLGISCVFRFDSEVSEFLSVLKLGTRNVYSRALSVFSSFT
jgi:hypothetical protein